MEPSPKEIVHLLLEVTKTGIGHDAQDFGTIVIASENADGRTHRNTPNVEAGFGVAFFDEIDPAEQIFAFFIAQRAIGPIRFFIAAKD